MLVVRAEIWPSGDEDRAIVIGTIVAANISDLAPTSSYAVEIKQRGDQLSGASAWKHVFEVVGHQRHHGVWVLVRKIVSLAVARCEASKRYEGF